MGSSGVDSLQPKYVPTLWVAKDEQAGLEPVTIRGVFDEKGSTLIVGGGLSSWDIIEDNTPSTRKLDD